MLGRVFPIIGVDCGYLWSRAPEASDAPEDEVAGEDPPDGVSNLVSSALWEVQRGSVAVWSSLSGKRGQREGIVPCWQRSCKLEATHGVVVRSDGEPAWLAHVWAAPAMTMVADVPARVSARARQQGAESGEWACGKRAQGEDSYLEAQHGDGV